MLDLMQVTTDRSGIPTLIHLPQSGTLSRSPVSLSLGSTKQALPCQQNRVFFKVRSIYQRKQGGEIQASSTVLPSCRDSEVSPSAYAYPDLTLLYFFLFLPSSQKAMCTLPMQNVSTKGKFKFMLKASALTTGNSSKQNCPNMRSMLQSLPATQGQDCRV